MRRERSPWIHRALTAAALAAAVTLAACSGDDDGGGGGITGPVPVAAVTVAAPAAPIEVGGTVQLTAKVTDAAGNVLNYAVTWTGDAYATVNANGLVTGKAPGLATITATSGGRAGTTRVQVEVPVALIELSPTTAAVVIGQPVTLTATPRNAAGDVVERAVVWTTSNPAVATVAFGVVTGVSLGEATITATSGGRTASATIRVVPPVASLSLAPATATLRLAETMPFVATVKDAAGEVLLGRAVTWRTANGAVATVTDGGVVTAVGVGTTELTATVEGRSTTATVTVIAPVASVAVAPAAKTLAMNETVQLTAAVLDGSGAALTRPVVWASGAPGVAAVDQNGLVTAVAPGVATITATSEGATGTAVVTVNAPVASVSVEPLAPTIYVGETVRLTASLVDGEGTPLERSILWASSMPGVATVDAAGQVRGLSGGRTTITATSEGIVGAANVTVLARVAAVAVAPATADVLTGETVQLTVTLTDAEGQTVVRPVSWTTDAPAVATVNATGLVTTLVAGTANVTATSEGKSATVAVIVKARVASVVLTPESASLLIGETLRLSAQALDADGNVLDRDVEFTSLRTSVASVAADGLVTALAAGDAAIVATVGGRADTATVTVLQPVASVTLASPADSIETTETVQLVAQALDAAGNVLDRAVTFTSSDEGVLTVGPTGLVSPVAPGVATITARSEGKSAARAIRVMVPVAMVEVVAPVTVVSVGQTLALSAVPRDANGQQLARRVAWETSDAAIATVTDAGLVTGVTEGSATISASAGGRRGDVTITVRPAVATVTITASSTMMTPETPVIQVTATLRDGAGNVIERTVEWSSSDEAVVTVVSTGSQSADVLFAGRGDATITATAEGRTGTVAIRVMGPPAGMEEANNNLSWPVIFADGVSLAGQALGTDPGLRPLPEEGITVDSLPFWYHLNTPDWLGTHFLQGGTNTWRAEWMDGTAAAMHGANVYFGDNITHHSYNTHSVMHIEIGLEARDATPLRGFNMTVLAGSMGDEIVGTDGTVGMFQPMLFTAHARIRVEKLDGQGGSPQFVVVDKTVAEGFGQDGEGYYRPELNKAGKVVYGYNLKIQDFTAPEGFTKYGWYRISFLLDDEAQVGGMPLQRRVSLNGLKAGTDEEAPTYAPVLGGDGRSAWVDVYIASASGGSH